MLFSLRIWVVPLCGVAIVLIALPGTMVTSGRTFDTPVASLVPRDLAEQSLLSIRIPLVIKLGVFLATALILKVIPLVNPRGVGALKRSSHDSPVS